MNAADQDLNLQLEENRIEYLKNNSLREMEAQGISESEALASLSWIDPRPGMVGHHRFRPMSATEIMPKYCVHYYVKPDKEVLLFNTEAEAKAASVIWRRALLSNKT